ARTEVDDKKKQLAALDKQIKATGTLTPAGQQLAATRPGLAGSIPEAQKAYEAMIKKIQAPDLAAGQRAAESGPAGAALLASKAAQESIRHQENTGAFYQGTQDVFEARKKQGMTSTEMMHSVAKAQNKIGDDNDRQSELLAAVDQRIQQSTQFQAPFQGRIANFQQSIGQLGALEQITPNTPAAQARLEAQKQTT